jgi:hypothetical protein
MRSFRAQLSATALLFAIAGVVVAADDDKAAAKASNAPVKSAELKIAVAEGQVARVEVTVEVGGTIQDEIGDKAEPRPTTVNANLSYEERIVAFPPAGKGDCRSVRYYDEPKGLLKVGTQQEPPTLAKEKRQVVVHVAGSESTLYSPGGMLTSSELDLIECLATNSLLIDRLLPDRVVKVNETWTHSEAELAAFLRLDRITKQDVQSSLLDVVENVARVQISGKVLGIECGAATEMELKAKYQYDLKQRRITWMGVLVREHRKPGEVMPSFDFVARLQLRITPKDKPEHLTDAVVAKIPAEAPAAQTSLLYTSDNGHWTLSYDRRWYMIRTAHDAIKLRLLESNEKICESEIVSQPQVNPAKAPDIEQFKAEIQKALGERLRETTDVSTVASPAGYRIYRVIGKGVGSQGADREVPVQWTYYYVGDKEGRQVVFVFVTTQENSPRVKDMDERLVASLRFAATKVAAKPAAGQKGDAKKQDRK